MQLSNTCFDVKKNDLQDVQVFQIDKDHFGVLIRLGSHVSKKLHALTQKAIGSPVTWVWEGRVLAVNMLSEPLDSVITIPNFTSQEIEQFRKYTNR